MKAAIYDTNGDIANVYVREVTKPVPLDHEALVKITYAASNPIDIGVLGGYMIAAGWKMPLPFIVGYDFAGVIESVGKNVVGFEPGDRVAAVNWGDAQHDKGDEPVGGAFAEYIALPASKLSKIPADVSDEQAAAVALIGTTAYQSLFDKLKIKAGSKILILGGSSAVGSIAIQLAKRAGAWVSTTASTRNLACTSQWKPDLLVDYTQSQWESHPQLRELDAVFDTVGDANALDRAVSNKVVRSDGSFLTIANSAVGFNPAGHPPLTFAAMIGLWNSPPVQDELFRLIASKELTVVVEDTFPFTEQGVRDLLSKQATKKSLGKNMLKVSA